MIYNHHLPREPKFKEVTRRVWEVGGKKVVTEAEFLERNP
jgi:predicted metallo-beta-lactamase superfamily hydrolase